MEEQSAPNSMTPDVPPPPDLALALSELGSAQNALDQRKKALLLAQEAVEL
jgi:hypothetical protein